eukprot:6519475-Alexandrium_andersonii.AAC.1
MPHAHPGLGRATRWLGSRAYRACRGPIPGPGTGSRGRASVRGTSGRCPYSRRKGAVQRAWAPQGSG